jgi:hypothetical protein
MRGPRMQVRFIIFIHYIADIIQRAAGIPRAPPRQKLAGIRNYERIARHCETLGGKK